MVARRTQKGTKKDWPPGAALFLVPMEAQCLMETLGFPQHGSTDYFSFAASRPATMLVMSLFVKSFDGNGHLGGVDRLILMLQNGPDDAVENVLFDDFLLQ